MATSSVEQGKKLAAYKAVDNHITPECKAVGIGSGSTVVYAVERIKERQDLHHIVYVPTSFQSRQLIIDGGLNLGDVERYPVLDVTIDGADELDTQLNAIKGGGACQFQEKLVAQAAKSFVMIVDYRKRSEALGTTWTQGVPIEVVPVAWKVVARALENDPSISQKPKKVTLRMAKMKAGPVVTDNANFVLDVDFGRIEDPSRLCREIKALTGVLEVGLFCHMAHTAYVGEENGEVATLTV